MQLINGGRTAPDSAVPRTGGIPLVPDGFDWPVCRECAGPMLFLAQLPFQDGVIAVFHCQNDPGLCDDWDATAGGNRALVLTGDLRPAAVPAEGETQLGAVTALRPEPSPAEDIPVLGRLGGAPQWLQGDETPDCPDCRAPMTFVASLEEGSDHSTAANFGGGGLSYVFACAPCAQAAFLWQC